MDQQLNGTPDQPSPTEHEHTLQLELSDTWPKSLSGLTKPILRKAIKAVNLLISDQAAFNRVYLPVCKKLLNVEINIDPEKFYNACMIHEKVLVLPVASGANIPSLNEEETLMLVDDVHRNNIIVNQRPFLILKDEYSRFCILVISFMHELAHILTPTFNEIVHNARDYGTPEHIGVIRDNEKVQQDCGYEMERLLFGGFLMFRDDGKVIFYIIKNPDLSIQTPHNVSKRPLKDAAIIAFGDLFEDLSLGNDRFPIEEIIKLFAVDGSLEDTQEEPSGEESEVITSRRDRINLLVTRGVTREVAPQILPPPKREPRRDIDIILARRGLGRLTSNK